MHAQYDLALAYADSLGVEQSDAQAALWYERAAKNGHIDAQFNLATLYRTGGNGVPQDWGKAIQWFQAAAEQGDAGAQYSLGLTYERQGYTA
ncbi:MAG: hypothetical protein AAF442_07410 [Pseudomonadota bacterium]